MIPNLECFLKRLTPEITLDPPKPPHSQQELTRLIAHIGVVVHRNNALIYKRRMQLRYRRLTDRESMTSVTVFIDGTPHAGHANLR